MTEQRQIVFAKQTRAVASCFLLFVFLMPAIAFGYYDLDLEGVRRDLDKVQMYYEKGKYNKARSHLAKVSEKVEGSPNGGLEYPENVRRQIDFLHSVIGDEQVDYDSYPKFIGKIVEIDGIYGGYLVVQSAKEKRTFFFYGGLMVQYEKKGRKTSSQAGRSRDTHLGALQDTKGLEGKRVTVYYDENLLGDLNAVKIVVHE